jgi:hypothetical protein
MKVWSASLDSVSAKTEFLFAAADISVSAINAQPKLTKAVKEPTSHREHLVNLLGSVRFCNARFFQTERAGATVLSNQSIVLTACAFPNAYPNEQYFQY